MSVDIEGGCSAIGLANGAWFWLLDNCIGEILGSKKHTNDPVNATAEQASKCAKAVAEAKIPEDVIPPWIVKLLVDHFAECGAMDGFETR